MHSSLILTPVTLQYAAVSNICLSNQTDTIGDSTFTFLSFVLLTPLF